LTFILTLIGSGLGTTIVAGLLKHRLDQRLELVKALLEQGSRIHERQIDALMTIYSKLEEASFYLQRVASAGRLKGEDEGQLLQRAGQALASASEEYSAKKLLFSDNLTNKIDEFFNQVLSANVSIGLALDPALQNAGSVAEFWDRAREAVYRQIPVILEAIRAEAKTVIHGDPS
jgi:hypothetical protein